MTRVTGWQLTLFKVVGVFQPHSAAHTGIEITVFKAFGMLVIE